MQIPMNTLEALPEGATELKVRRVHLLNEGGTPKILFLLEDEKSGREWTWECSEGRLHEVFQA